MNRLNRVFAAVSGAALRTYRVLILGIVVPLLGLLFGSFRWTPPGWLRKLAQKILSYLRVGWTRMQTARRDKPKPFWVTVSLAVTLLIGSIELQRYYDSLPKPYTLRVTVSAPTQAKFDPTAIPTSLFVAFSGSAAPIGMSGKVVASGITVTPPIAGEWKWNSDSALMFRPTEPWPLGQAYQITIQPTVIASHVLLDKYVYNFETPGLSGSFAKSEFYQDPTTPTIKKVVATLSFTQPIDKQELERRISVRMRVSPIKSFDDEGVKNLGFTVSYNEFATEAYVHSEQLTIPPENADVMVKVAAGAKSSVAGPARLGEMDKTVYVPGIESYFRIESFSATAVETARGDMERVGTIETSASAEQETLAPKVSVYLLPKDRPAIGDEEAVEDYTWSSPDEVVPEVLKKSEKLPIEWIPSENPHSTAHSFKFTAAPEKYVLVKVDKGAKSSDGYELIKNWGEVFQAEEFPRTLKIMSDGALLSLGGEKKLGIMARNIPGVKVELARLLPETINHLVSITDGNFQKPNFSASGFGLDNLAERLEETMTLPQVSPGKNQYSYVDLGKYLRDEKSPRGLFYLKIRGFDPKKAAQAQAAPTESNESEDESSESSDESESDESESEPDSSLESIVDERLVLITDLGIVVKDTVDGSSQLFVTSFRERGPVPQAKVSLLGRNGLPLFTAETDADGRVSFPSTQQFLREKRPTVYIAEHNGDLAFLPFGRSDRRLDLSRFDTGGLYNSEQIEGLQASLFSDRGIYRPGDEVRIGMIVKAREWTPLPEGLPLELVVTDPRSVEIRHQTIRFGATGLEEYRFGTREDSPTGSYQMSLYVIQDGNRKGLLGTTSVRVEDFQPDQMTVKAEFAPAVKEGWLAPEALAVEVRVRNLFGTAAAGRKVQGSMSLAPWYPSFPKYPGFSFSDPFAAKRASTDDLGELVTDDEGFSSFDLDMKRFEPKTFRITFAAEAFELDSGRSVVNTVAATVSPAKHLLGFKPDGDLSYINLNAPRSSRVIAIDPTLEQIELPKVNAELVEHRYISVLTKQDDGTFAYQSVLKHLPKGSKEITVPKAGLVLPLDTSAAGSFTLTFRDSDGTELNAISYEVIGEGNVRGDLERDAELRLRLNRKSYEPGEEIELEIEAPYTGHGLITIERDKMFSAKWFTADTTSSVQRITVPEELEGNGYLTVTFIRALDSSEVFMSPLSYGSVPFNVGRKKRTHQVTIDAPERIRPGEVLPVTYQSDRDAKLILFAIDEGILQVARYKTPDPLSHFFRKRALEVRTSQILDLLLPEFEILKSRAAAGGDEDAELGKYHNPFKRRRELPVAFWSGIVDSGPTARTISIPIPEYFNGTVRIMAVAASETAVGVAERKAQIRGDFVLQPQSPVFVAPGDEFEVGALIANNLEGSGPDASLKVSLESTSELEFPEGTTQELNVPQGKDRSVRFLARARDVLGAARLRMKVEGLGKEAGYSLEMSVRPATPLMTTISSAYAKSGLVSGNRRELPVTRTLFTEKRQVEASASLVPLGLAQGLVEYLRTYPHGCTEQVTSQAIPGVILGARPEFRVTKKEAQQFIDRAFAALQSRQKAGGGFAMWPGNDLTEPFYTAYATHFLIEAREHGFDVPSGLIERAVEYLKSEAKLTVASDNLVARAYQLYVLTRAGVLVTNEVSAFRERLDVLDSRGNWMQSKVGPFLAGTYRLLKLDEKATDLLGDIDPSAAPTDGYRSHGDSVTNRALYFYIVSKHFPELVKKYSGEEILGLADGIQEGYPNSLSAGFSILALDAYAGVAVKPDVKPIRISEVLRDGTLRPLQLEPSLLVHSPVAADAVALRFEGESKMPLFYQLTQSGFDKSLPDQTIADGFEVFHEYIDEDGKPVTSLSLNDKLYARLTVRGRSFISDVAVVELFPGGFEPDITPEGLGSRKSLKPGADTWSPDYIDVREDRIVFYGTVPDSSRTFVYRLKPTNKGTFAIPPAYGEAMYDRKKQARSLGGKISVVE